MFSSPRCFWQATCLPDCHFFVGRTLSHTFVGRQLSFHLITLSLVVLICVLVSLFCICSCFLRTPSLSILSVVLLFVPASPLVAVLLAQGVELWGNRRQLQRCLLLRSALLRGSPSRMKTKDALPPQAGGTLHRGSRNPGAHKASEGPVSSVDSTPKHVQMFALFRRLPIKRCQRVTPIKNKCKLI